MDLYRTDFEDADALRRNDARSVDAWMRAAAYAAGEDPEALLSGVPAHADLSDESSQAALNFLA